MTKRISKTYTFSCANEATPAQVISIEAKTAYLAAIQFARSEYKPDAGLEQSYVVLVDDSRKRVVHRFIVDAKAVLTIRLTELSTTRKGGG